MTHEEDLRESEVFAQALSLDDLGAVAGGEGCTEAFKTCICSDKVRDDSGADYNCTESRFRRIYEGGFPRCAATVESGSFCGTNDACYFNAVVYVGMVGGDCKKAWR